MLTRRMFSTLAALVMLGGVPAFAQDQTIDGASNT